MEPTRINARGKDGNIVLNYKNGQPEKDWILKKIDISWGRPAEFNNCRKFYAVILEDAVQNALWHQKKRGNKSEWVLNSIDLNWIKSDENYFNSFLTICELLDLNAEKIRAGILKKNMEIEKTF